MEAHRVDRRSARPRQGTAHRAILFIHHGPSPGDRFPNVAGDTDNARRGNDTLDMQASPSSVMVTLCPTDYFAPYTDAMILVHNLGGTIPYEIERMDHRSMLDTGKEELPSSRFHRAKVYVDCNSFGPRAIEAAVRLRKRRSARMPAAKILHRNAAAMLSRHNPRAGGERQKTGSNP